MLCRVLEIQWYLKALTSSRRRDHKQAKKQENKTQVDIRKKETSKALIRGKDSLSR